MDSTGLIERCERLAALADRRLALPIPNPAAEGRARQLHDHIEGSVRPRAADVDAPLLVLLLGPTGAGKSSLLNTIAGAEVSKAGVLRPTTRPTRSRASGSNSSAAKKNSVGSDGRSRLTNDPSGRYPMARFSMMPRPSAPANVSGRLRSLPTIAAA